MVCLLYIELIVTNISLNIKKKKAFKDYEKFTKELDMLYSQNNTSFLTYKK